MKAVIIDDSKVYLEMVKKVLCKEGWGTQAIHITAENRESFRLEKLDQEIPLNLEGVDLVVSDLEFGGNVN